MGYLSPPSVIQAHVWGPGAEPCGGSRRVQGVYPPMLRRTGRGPASQEGLGGSPVLPPELSHPALTPSELGSLPLSHGS